MTNKRPLIDKLLNNWPVKVVCLIVAIFLYIFHQASLVDKKTIVVPLNIIEDGIVMHVGNVPQAVSVVVRTNASEINSIHNSDISASINLDTITEKGKYRIPVQLSITNRLYEIDPLEIKLKDETIEIDVDKKAVKYVTLTPSVIGEVAHGFKVSDILMNPSTVEVSGPKTILDAIDQISTTKINISNAETTFTSESYCIEASSLINIDNKGPYRATVVVNPIDHEATFVGIKPQIVHLSDSFEIDGILPELSVRMAGSMKNLESYIPSDSFAQIDLTNITEAGEYEVPVKYNIPSIFDLIERSNSTIKINVKKAPEPETAEESIEGEPEGEGEDEKPQVSAEPEGEE